jgi:hypothetical protein
MTSVRLPSLVVPEVEKRSYTEADVHSKLFESDMRAMGYPRRENKQSDGEYFLEQRALAVRRLKSRVDRSQRGHYDGLYLVGNAPVVLCEIKRYDALDSPRQLEQAVVQLQEYARSDDFDVPPPFLVLYSGRADRTHFFRRRAAPDGPRLDSVEYEQLDEIWDWDRVRAAHVTGVFAEEVVSRERLKGILLHHLNEIEDDLRADVSHAVTIVSASSVPTMLSPFGRWLVDNRIALERMRHLYERKVAEIGSAAPRQVVEEMVTQAALNYLNKVFFLALCEDRNLPGFYRIMREFLPTTKSFTTPATATVFLGLLRRKLKDSTEAWSDDEEAAYQSLRAELVPQIRDHVIEQNNWWQLIRVAFDLAEERFPLVYREDAYDYFRPSTEVLAELIYDLSTKSFRSLTNRHVGDIYQGLLSSRRNRQQQSKLGAFYTPRGDVDYMVANLRLTRDSRVLDPCMGSGHFLEGIYESLARLYAAEGIDGAATYSQIVGRQIYGGDIDTFATSLAAIRLFLLDEEGTRTPPNLYVHDMLLHSPERPGTQLFSPEVLAAEGRGQAVAEHVVGADPELDAVGSVDEREFDAVVGNPPYGARKPDYKKRVYAQLYGRRDRDRRAGSIATGDEDTYGMFFASGIERLCEGGRLCLITNDSFRSLTTHSALRRHILDRCKIVEILLTDTRHFEGVSFQFAGMAITTLEKCSVAEARASNVMRLVDYVRDPADFATPPADQVFELRQEEYEALADTPFFVGVPNEVFEAAKKSRRVRDVARGRVGLQTSDDQYFLAGVDGPTAGLPKVIRSGELATSLTQQEREHGVGSNRTSWVPFAKGEGYGEYWRAPGVAIDWSREAVAELKRRDGLAAGTPRKPRFQNRQYYFRAGLTYSVVSSGRLSVRLMPEGWVFGHKGSAIFVEDEGTSELFLLGYLNSALATYFMKRIVNTTATADVGYVEKLPYRDPPDQLRDDVVERVKTIIQALRSDPAADVSGLRNAINDAIFDLYDIGTARGEVKRFYEAVGRAAPSDQAASAEVVSE